MEKLDYNNKVFEMIKSGPYQELFYTNGKAKNSRNNMIAEATVCAKSVSKLVNDKH